MGLGGEPRVGGGRKVKRPQASNGGGGNAREEGLHEGSEGILVAEEVLEDAGEERMEEGLEGGLEEWWEMLEGVVGDKRGGNRWGLWCIGVEYVLNTRSTTRRDT